MCCELTVRMCAGTHDNKLSRESGAVQIPGNANIHRAAIPSDPIPVAVKVRPTVNSAIPVEPALFSVIVRNRPAAARMAEEWYPRALMAVAVAHLSEHCNGAKIGRATVGATLEPCGFDGTLGVAPRDHPIEPVDIESLRRRAAPAQMSFY